jgi:hypothetical protein
MARPAIQARASFSKSASRASRCCGPAGYRRAVHVRAEADSRSRTPCSRCTTTVGPALQDRGVRPSRQPFRGGTQPVPFPRSTILSAGLVPFPLPVPWSRARAGKNLPGRANAAGYTLFAVLLATALGGAARRSWFLLLTQFFLLSQHEKRKPSSEPRSARGVSDPKVRLAAARMRSPD